MGIANLVVCPEVVNLFLVQSHPEILADKFHQIELILEPWTVTCYPNRESITRL